MKLTNALCLVCVLMFCFEGIAQVDGLWLVKSVTVGTVEKTPIGKWFRLTNGKQLSGNGWQQHTFGSYRWNKTTSELSLQSENEPSDGFGAFTVTRKGNTMTWTRDEEGAMVKVNLETITELPQSPADQVKGLWDLVLATRGKLDVTREIDPDGNQFAFIRWDRVYVRQLSSKEQVRGYWFMNAHQPELKFISEDSKREQETWAVNFDEGNLVLSGVSENVKGSTLMFARMAQFMD